MKIINLLSLSAIIAASLLLISGCSGESNVEPLTVTKVADLLPGLFIESESGWDLISSPRRLYHFAHGWSRSYHDEELGKSVVVATARECVLEFDVVNPTDRWLKFKANRRAQFRGPTEKQRCSIFIGKKKLKSFNIRNIYRQNQVLIPAEFQIPGTNELRFVFDEYYENIKYLKTKNSHDYFPYPGVAAYFGDFALVPDEGGEPSKPLEEGRFPAVSIPPNTEIIRQRGNSRFSFVVDKPQGQSIAFRGQIANAISEEPVGYQVFIESRTDDNPNWQELWKSSGSATDGDISIFFDGEVKSISGNLVEIRFSFLTEKPYSPLAIVWHNLSINENSRIDNSAAKDKSSTKVTEVPKAKNVVIIVMDALSAKSVGAYGADHGATPAIDAFAEESILFEQALASAPYTISSVSTLFSGVSPAVHRVLDRFYTFPDGLQNMTDSFNKKGFYTLALAGTQYITAKFGITTNSDEIVQLRKEEDITLDLSGMDMAAAEKAVARAAASGKPLFLYAHFLPPHWPYKPPKPYNSKYISDPEFDLWNFRHDFWRIESLFAEKLVDKQHPEIRKMYLTYLNNLVYADYLLTETIRILKDNNLYDDSIVIVTSDHGESFGLHGYPGHNNTVQADMIRVPLMIHIPGVSARRVSKTVGLVDIFPTLNAMFELGEDVSNFEGRDFTSLLSGSEDFTAKPYYLRAVIDDVYGWQQGQMKYLSHQFRDYFFDLASDPDELKNLFNDRPVLARWLRQQLFIYRNNVELGEGLQSKDVILEEKDREELENLGYIQ